MGGNKNYFLEVQEKLNDVFDVYEHVKGVKERDVKEDEVYGLLIELVSVLMGSSSCFVRETYFNDINGTEH